MYREAKKELFRLVREEMLKRDDLQGWERSIYKAQQRKYVRLKADVKYEPHAVVLSVRRCIFDSARMKLRRFELPALDAITIPALQRLVPAYRQAIASRLCGRLERCGVKSMPRLERSIAKKWSPELEGKMHGCALTIDAARKLYHELVQEMGEEGPEESYCE